MPKVTMETLTQSLYRLPQVIRSIPDVIRNPAANPLQATILLGIALVLVLIVLLSVVLLIVRPDDEEDYLLDEEGYDRDDEDYDRDGSAVPDESGRLAARLTVMSISILVFVGIWTAAGISTSNSKVCTSCHNEITHASGVTGDAHGTVSCVLCHETGGPVARATVNLATRLLHVVYAELDTSRAFGFGTPVASDGCLSCHRKQIRVTSQDRERGIRMSHKEPLAAGAQCVYCHTLISGVLGAQTVGMSPCLRCHNGTVAKVECSVCHIGDPGDAIRARTPLGAMASAQVPNPGCRGCHFSMAKCNKCHGISMPHDDRFKAYYHARAGALDLWNNKGRTCFKCHYPGHRNCQQDRCHIDPFTGHGSVWRKMHQDAPWASSSKTCSCHMWNPWSTPEGLVYCEICHLTKPKNAKP
jgi:hypothetical protein